MITFCLKKNAPNSYDELGAYPKVYTRLRLGANGYLLSDAVLTTFTVFL